MIFSCCFVTVCKRSKCLFKIILKLSFILLQVVFDMQIISFENTSCYTSEGEWTLSFGLNG